MFHHHLPLLLAILSLAGLAMWAAGQPGVRDALLKITRALPASTTAVVSTSIDTGAATTDATQPAFPEWLLTAPAVTTTQLPDAKTFTYDVVASASADLGTPTTVLGAVIVQTGAGGAGAAAATFRFRLPSVLPGTGSRYLGFRVTPSASGTGDASGASATLEVLM